MTPAGPGIAATANPVVAKTNAAVAATFAYVARGRSLPSMMPSVEFE
jgi:hypothetical protein